MKTLMFSAHKMLIILFYLIVSNLQQKTKRKHIFVGWKKKQKQIERNFFPIPTLFSLNAIVTLVFLIFHINAHKYFLMFNEILSFHLINSVLITIRMEKIDFEKNVSNEIYLNAMWQFDNNSLVKSKVIFCTALHISQLTYVYIVQ